MLLVYVDWIIKSKVWARELTNLGVLMGSRGQNISNQNRLGKNLGRMFILSLTVPSLMYLVMGSKKTGFLALSDL